MPRYTKKYKRPGYKACGKMVYSDASKALKIAMGVKRLLNVEFKFHDVKITSAAQSTSPVAIQLSNILQGDGGSTRDGSQVKVTGIYLNYLWVMSASATTTQIRVLLVHDKQTNGAIYASGDVLSDALTIKNIISPYNLDNKYRFRILYDKVHLLNDNSSQSAMVSKYIPIDQRIRYDGTTGNISDITSSSYSLLVMSSESSNYPIITHFSRLRFVDN